MIIRNIKDTNNMYSLVYTDPPWPQKQSGFRSARPNQKGSFSYKVMSLEDIEVLHKSFFEKNTNISHNVFMWAVDKYLPFTEEMMSRLGYKLHTRMIWDKTNGIAAAFTVRFSHEYLLWFYKPGKMLKPSKETRGKYSTVFREQSSKHSKKPEIAYLMLEDMFPDVHKVELFARLSRDGWDSFGDEL